MMNHPYAECPRLHLDVIFRKSNKLGRIQLLRNNFDMSAPTVDNDANLELALHLVR